MTVRPVMRQTFTREELLDMILSVTGKDAERVRQIPAFRNCRLSLFSLLVDWDLTRKKQNWPLRWHSFPTPSLHVLSRPRNAKWRYWNPATQFQDICLSCIASTGQSAGCSAGKVFGTAFSKLPVMNTWPTTSIRTDATRISIALIWTARIFSRFLSLRSAWLHRIYATRYACWIRRTRLHPVCLSAAVYVEIK